MLSLEALFCDVDDFCQWFEKQWKQKLLGDGMQQRQRSRSLCLSEIMTILIAFHQSAYRNFKWFYTHLVCGHWRDAFPTLVSYNRFVEWLPSVLIPLCAYLRHCFGQCTGISFIDSTSLKVCHNRRITSHKVFHPGNTDDRTPVPKLLQRLFGKVFGDRGYVSQKLALRLWQQSGIQLITRLRRNMKNRLMLLSDKLLLRRRAIIESIIDQLKNISQIEHSRHRSPVNGFVNVICGLIAYCHQPKKPSLLIDEALPASA
jgi:hypothetical protein